MVFDAGGWLVGARWVPSPNCDARPADTVVDTLVVHGISLPPGCFGHGAIEAFFTNRPMGDAHPFFRQIRCVRVSAHFLIERAGRLTQFVAVDDRAWHAGPSVLAGRTGVNDFAVGVELEGTDDCPYAPAQYARLAGVYAALGARFRALTANRIVAHSAIAPGRKTDPGPAFDWAWLAQLLAGAGISDRKNKPSTNPANGGAP